MSRFVWLRCRPVRGRCAWEPWIGPSESLDRLGAFFPFIQRCGLVCASHVEWWKSASSCITSCLKSLGEWTPRPFKRAVSGCTPRFAQHFLSVFFRSSAPRYAKSSMSSSFPIFTQPPSVIFAVPINNYDQPILLSSQALCPIRPMIATSAEPLARASYHCPTRAPLSQGQCCSQCSAGMGGTIVLGGSYLSVALPGVVLRGPT